MGRAGTPHSTASGYAHGTQGTAPAERVEATGFNKSLEISRKKGQEPTPCWSNWQFLANLHRKLASVDTSLFPKRAYIRLDFWQHFSPERLLQA